MTNITKLEKIGAFVEIENRFASEGLKSVFYLNGVAAISMLTFIGSLAVSETSSLVKIESLALPLLYFSLGAAMAVCANGLAYFSAFNMALFIAKDTDSSDIRKKLEIVFRRLAQFAGIISWIFFSVGIFVAYRSFS